VQIIVNILNKTLGAINGFSIGLIKGLHTGLLISKTIFKNSFGNTSGNGFLDLLMFMLAPDIAKNYGIYRGALEGFRGGIEGSIMFSTKMDHLNRIVPRLIQMYRNGTPLSSDIIENIIAQDMTEGARDLPEEQIGEGEKRTRLINRINALPNAAPLQFLTQRETETFKQAIDDMKDQKEQETNKNKLNTYLNYLNNRCLFSLTPINEITNPITLEATFEADEKHQQRKWVKTYDLDQFKTYIGFKPINQILDEPETRDELTNRKHVYLTRGLPSSIVDVVNFVRETNKKFTAEKCKPQTTAVMPKENLRTLRLKYYNPRLYANTAAVPPLQTANLIHGNIINAP
jgi:hypothetical protein